MWLSWAFVSRTLAIAGVVASWSADDEQPVSVSASAPRTAPPIALASIGAHQFRLMPPSSAKRLEQRRGVGEAVRLGLDEAQARLLICLVRIEDREIGCVAVFVLEA